MTKINPLGDVVYPGSHGYSSADELPAVSERLRDERRTADMDAETDRCVCGNNRRNPCRWCFDNYGIDEE